MATRLLLIHLQQLTYQPVVTIHLTKPYSIKSQFMVSDSPYLYMVQTQVIVDGKVADTYKSTMGFRYLNFSSTTGFL